MEARSDVLDRIAATNPLPHGARVDPVAAERTCNAIVARLRPPAKRWTSNRLLVVSAVVVALAAVAAPTLAFSDGVRSFLGLEPPQPVFEKSRLLVSAPVAESTVAHLWASPSRTGGECVFVTFATPGKVERPSMMTGGGSCSLAPRSETVRPMSVGVSVSRYGTAPPGAAAGIPPLVEGYVDPSLGATRVEIEWTGGSKRLAYANGYFLGSVRELFKAPPEASPIRVVAYDADGREVQRKEIDGAVFRLD